MRLARVKGRGLIVVKLLVRYHEENYRKMIRRLQIGKVGKGVTQVPVKDGNIRLLDSTGNTLEVAAAHGINWLPFRVPIVSCERFVVICCTVNFAP
jgi:hypothetical protein